MLDSVLSILTLHKTIACVISIFDRQHKLCAKYHYVVTTLIDHPLSWCAGKRAGDVGIQKQKQTE